MFALPMAHTEAMLAFYRHSGGRSRKRRCLFGLFRDNKINFHRPAHWQDRNLRIELLLLCRLRDLCFVWEGTAESLKVFLDRAGQRWR